MDPSCQLPSTSVLVVAPESSRRATLRATLSGEVGFVTCRADRPRSLREIGPESSVVSTMVLSVDRLDTPPVDAVQSIRARWPWMSLLLIDAPDSVQTAQSAMRRGADEYLVRERSTAETISEVVARSLERSWQTEIGGVLYTRSGSEKKLIGSSDAMEPMLRRLGIATENDLNVLLYGESGTGKTLTARTIHGASAPEGAPLMQIDCRTLGPERARTLFLDASSPARPGSDVPAGRTALRDLVGGTLVLDHVNELPSEAQDVVAHALDTRDRTPPGSADRQGTIQFIGVLSASPPLEDVRSDLYHNLAELPIALPPLRERSDDILPLARHFLRKHGGSVSPDTLFSAEAAAALRDFSWPGNVRQLENVIKRSIRISSSYPLGREDLLLPNSPSSTNHDAPPHSEADPPRPPSRARTPSPEGQRIDANPFVAVPDASDRDGMTFDDPEHNFPSLEEVKKQAVKRAYDLFEGDVERAAVALDIGRSTVYRMLKRHNLRDDDA